MYLYLWKAYEMYYLRSNETMNQQRNFNRQRAKH